MDVAISVSPIRDPAGEPGGFSVLARDITRRKLAEADLRRQERWQAANAEIRMALLSGVSIPSVLELICRRAAELVEAASAVILTADGDAVRAVASHGPAAPPPGRALHPPPLIVSRAVAGARTEVEAGPGAVDVGASDQAGDGLGPGPRLAAPLLSDGTSRGALVLIRDSGTNAFTPAETLVAESFAGQAGLALELADAVHRREELLLAEERDRIARDLHDLVIQRLFSTGLALAAVSPLVGDGRVASRLGGAVDELDTVIREIRQTIFALETPAPAASGVRAQVQRMAVAASDGLGFEPAVRFDGPVDNAVPHEVVPHLLAVVREALSNIARHAHATHAEVHLSAGDDLIVVIADNGVGLGTPARHSGLRNCRFRAERLGGTLDLTAAPGGGTRLEWRVPIGRHSDG